MSVSLSIAKAVRWSAAGRTLAQIFRWCITLVVIRILAPEDYGLVALAIALLDIIGPFLEMGLASALIQSKKLDEEDIAKVSGLILTINTAICLAFVALSPLIAGFFEEPKLTAVLCMLVLVFPIGGLASAPNAVLRRNLDFKKVALLNMGAEMSGAIVSLTLALSGYGVWALVFGHLTFTIIKMVLSFFACPIRCLPRFDFRGTKRFVNFGGVVALQHLITAIFARSDVFILGRAFDTATVGIYSVAHEFGSMPTRKIAPVINEIAFAGFSKIQDNKALITSYLEKAFRFLALFGLPIFAGMSSVAPELTAVVLGPKWSSAALPLQFLSLAAPLRMFSSPLQMLLNSVGQARLALENTLITAALMISGFLIGSQYGIIGMCVVWLTCMPTCLAIILMRAAPHTGLGFGRFLQLLGPPIATSALMYVAIIALGRFVDLPVDSPLRLGLLVGTGALVYGIVILLLRPQDVFKLWAFIKS